MGSSVVLAGGSALLAQARCAGLDSRQLLCCPFLYFHKYVLRHSLIHTNMTLLYFSLSRTAIVLSYSYHILLYLLHSTIALSMFTHT